MVGFALEGGLSYLRRRQSDGVPGFVIFLGRAYVPFRVAVSEGEHDVCIVKANSKIDEAETQTKPPFSENELKEQLDRFALMAEGKITPAEGELREFGQELYRMLFHDAVWDLLKKSTVAAEHADGLLVELDIQSPKLSRIPWELLHDGKDFLALSRRTQVIRSVATSESGMAGEAKPIELPLRILFVCAKPWGPVPLNMGGQIRHVCQSLRKATQEGLVALHPALGEEVQPDRFRTALRTEGYHVLHISTHGAFSEDLNQGFVLLEDGMGNAVPVAITALAGMIRDTTVQLVYLDACETGLASTQILGGSLSETLIRSGANAAVAMQFKIEDETATRFSETFYHYLMNGEPIWYSVTEARIALQDLLGRETIDWAIPVLYTRDDYTPSMIRKPSQKVRKLRTEPRCVGREAQLDELAEKLLHPSARVVVVHGFGGIGKSTLVQKMMSEFELLFEDVCYVDCRGMTDISLTIPKIGSMLSVNGFPLLDERLRSINVSGRLEYLCEQLDKGRFLVVLDNIDGLQENRTAATFFDVTEGFHNAKIIVACRIPHKSVTHQRELKLGALDTRHAIDLIREVGRDIPQISNATDSDLRRINEKLRGHPLSIMVAIPYFKAEPFETVLEKLPTRIGSEDEQAGEVLAWSYSRLGEEERRFLENASVFYGEVPMGAMLGINDTHDPRTLAGLVNKNMIEFISFSGLYSLHPMLRQYAYEQLHDRRHEIHMQAAQEIAPRLVDPGFWTEALRLYEAGVDSARRTRDKNVLADLLTGLGDVYHRIGEYGKAEGCQQESLNTARRLGYKSGIAKAVHSLGIVEESRGHYGEAKKLYNQSLKIRRKLGDRSGIAVTLHQLASIEHLKGHYGEAKKLYNQSLKIKRKLGSESGISKTLHNLGLMEQERGNYGEAKELYNQSLKIKRKLGDKLGIASTLHQLANMEILEGHYGEAKKLYDQVRDAFEKLGDQSGIAAALHQLGIIEQHKGNYDEAKKLYSQSLEIMEKLGDQSAIATTLGQLGRLAEEKGDLEAAGKYYQQALKIFEKLGTKPYIEIAKKDLERVQKLKPKQKP